MVWREVVGQLAPIEMYTVALTPNPNSSIRRGGSLFSSIHPFPPSRAEPPYPRRRYADPHHGNTDAGHRRHKGSSAGSSSVHPPARAAASHRKPSAARAAASYRKPLPAKRISSAAAETPCHGRSKRSSSSEATRASYPTWVMLCRVGARWDSFRGDRTTSAVSCTSGGEEISVSFELVKPPRTSLLTLDWPQGPRPSEGSTCYPIVIAAHRNVVLLEIIYGAKYRRPAGIDHFVYKAGGEYPSLTRLPICYWKGPWNADSPWPRRMNREAVGLLSYSKDLSS
jgi:hypothetical protein